jgi:hypothetical protein
MRVPQRLKDDANVQKTLPASMKPVVEDESASDDHRTYVDTDSAEEWALVYDELKRRDEQMVTEYREEVDTLLVFVRPPTSIPYP